jgi:voltage-gated potassium channel
VGELPAREQSSQLLAHRALAPPPPSFFRRSSSGAGPNVRTIQLTKDPTGTAGDSGIVEPWGFRTTTPHRDTRYCECGYRANCDAGSLAQALATSITITSCAVLVAAAAVTYTDPEQFPHLGVGLWWAAATVTTVGYGDVVPSSPGGRLIGGLLMFLGIASLALLTAIAASAIVVGEVRSEEREIEREETEILSELRNLASRMSRLERMNDEHFRSEGRMTDTGQVTGVERKRRSTHP